MPRGWRGAARRRFFPHFSRQLTGPRLRSQLMHQCIDRHIGRAAALKVTEENEAVVDALTTFAVQVRGGGGVLMVSFG